VCVFIMAEFPYSVLFSAPADAIHTETKVSSGRVLYSDQNRFFRPSTEYEFTCIQ
jgi:hypothetical protein